MRPHPGQNVVYRNGEEGGLAVFYTQSTCYRSGAFSGMMRLSGYKCMTWKSPQVPASNLHYHLERRTSSEVSYLASDFLESGHLPNRHQTVLPPPHV